MIAVDLVNGLYYFINENIFNQTILWLIVSEEVSERLL